MQEYGGALSQYKVPQKIDLEDKIFGPLTLMQFIYLMSGGMIIYAAFELADTVLFWIIAIPVGLLTLSLAFVKIQDQPFSKFLICAVIFIIKPKKRIWHKNPMEEKFRQEIIPEKQIPAKKKAEPKKVEKSELEKLANILDTSSIDKIAKYQNIEIEEGKKEKEIISKEKKEAADKIIQASKENKNNPISPNKSGEVEDMF